MKDCPFCHPKLTLIVRESSVTRVVLSNPRLMKGHVLVVPKRHVERPWGLEGRELDEIFSHIRILQKILTETFGTGCDIRQNYRPFIKQGRLKVDHVHFHLLPRTFEDELYRESVAYESDIFANVSNQEVTEVLGLLGREIPGGFGH